MADLYLALPDGTPLDFFGLIDPPAIAYAPRRTDGLDDRLVPPGVKDGRGRALMAALAKGFDAIPLDALRIDYDTVDVALLPTLVRGLSLQEFMYTGIDEATVRLFLKNAVPLHLKKGRIDGIRFGLSLLGMRAHWVTWFEDEPVAPPNTYRATIFLSDATLLAEAGFSQTIMARGRKMVRAMKRHSQEGALRFGAATDGRIYLGATARVGGIITVRNLAPANQNHQATIRVGALSRIGGIVRVRGEAA